MLQKINAASCVVILAAVLAGAPQIAAPKLPPTGCASQTTTGGGGCPGDPLVACMQLGGGTQAQGGCGVPSGASCGEAAGYFTLYCAWNY